MYKTVRLSSLIAALAALILAFSQIAALAGAVQEPVPERSGTRTTPEPTKNSKKRKKKKTETVSAPVVAVPFVVQQAAMPIAPASAPSAVEGTAATAPATVPTTASTSSRGGSRATKLPGVRISPVSEQIPGTITPAILATTAGQLVISEFRYRGPAGTNDEFIELYNTTGAALTAQASDASGGLGVAASDGVTRCVVPNGTVIPAGGHFLCTNSVAYSLGAYPAGNGTTATGDATYAIDIPDNVGIAIFNNSTGGASYSLANRIDAVGTTAEANTTYKEGTGLPTLIGFNIDSAWVRDTCGKQGSITVMGPCPSSGLPVDTNNNATDFYFVDTNGTSAGGGQRLGTPGPENLSSPVLRNSTITATLLDPCVGAATAPNRVRDFTSDPGNNSTFGTLDIRRTFTNNTGANVTRLRFRVIDVTTFPAPAGVADLRPRTSPDVVVTVDRPPCGSGTSNITVRGTTLEQPPNQPNGGGFNSSMSAGTVTLGSPIPPGGTIDIRWLLGIQQTGLFKFYVNVEALP